MKNVILFLVGWMICLSTQANQAEIQHLMAFVQQTACEYERNGTRHSGKDALEHIQKKYDYYEDDIQTTEDFIRLSATKSTISGKEYWVHCPNTKAITSQQWLLDELNRLRQSYQ